MADDSPQREGMAEEGVDGDRQQQQQQQQQQRQLAHPTSQAAFTSFPAAGYFQQQAQQRQEGMESLFRAAERYLESSSSSGDEGATAATAGLPSGGAAGPGGSPARKRSRRGEKGDTAGAGAPRGSHKQHKHSHSKRHKAPSEREKERDKIARLEAAAAAGGILRHAQPAATRGGFASRPGGPPGARVSGAAPVAPALLYYDSQGDMQNLVYEGLYAGNVALYRRLDPRNLARDVRRGMRLAQMQDGSRQAVRSNRCGLAWPGGVRGGRGGGGAWRRGGSGGMGGQERSNVGRLVGRADYSWLGDGI